MIELAPNLFVGNDSDCQLAAKDFAIVHACKTCHQKGVGYRGNLSSTHSNYLVYENGNHLFLNLVDMDKEFLPKYTHPIMKSAMSFISKNIERRKVLVHCNQGQSRSPAICLVYLVKTGKIIKGSSYQEAKNEFSGLYPVYQPGIGFERYLIRNWWEVLKL